MDAAVEKRRTSPGSILGFLKGRGPTEKESRHEQYH